MDRNPVVAGQFYPDNAAALWGMIDQFHGLAERKRQASTLLAMVPHAGYVFSGAVCGKTLASANLHPTVLMLGPNHTGMGAELSLWNDGDWLFPEGRMPLDRELADALMAAEPRLTPDRGAHVREHSLEVIVPFLHRLNPATTMVPVAVSAPSLDVLEGVGRAVGRALKSFERPVSIVVSSDMSHYISHEQAKRRDSMALEAALGLDPARLFSVVRENRISMCGILPMTLGLFAALEMGAEKAELAAYATSGDVSGDYEQVVGYAGVLVS
ncbi:AmmeMemoRadiSam system protein B [Salidesulfovibrio onnuriiensis]|uniref:AmmeMemoRadiSam system protein B n=1 Tax=Salidesulfovibrio onnuriiensis TaxID=2583823 RepID=UPI0011CB611B|nr:AmmeMemoRadiSam system protein B [Salidesulfovibrio onnuriiensis]